MMAAQSKLMSLPTELLLAIARYAIPEATHEALLLCYPSRPPSYLRELPLPDVKGEVVATMTGNKGLFKSFHNLRTCALDVLFASKTIYIWVGDNKEQCRFASTFIEPNVHRIKSIVFSVSNDRTFQWAWELLRASFAFGAYLNEIHIQIKHVESLKSLQKSLYWFARDTKGRFVIEREAGKDWRDMTQTRLVRIMPHPLQGNQAQEAGKQIHTPHMTP